MAEIYGIVIALLFTNFVALGFGIYFDKFKITAIILTLFDVASIITFSKLI